MTDEDEPLRALKGSLFTMVAALLGKKVGMTRVYTESGEAVPVTVALTLRIRTLPTSGE